MRVIIEYTREERVKYISHLDLMRTMQRAVRRGGIPVAWSQGFNPHPLIAFASALAVGVTSSAEYMDIVLDSPMIIAEIISRFNDALPKGITVKDAGELDDRTPSLMSLIGRADYIADIGAPDLDFGRYVSDFLKQKEILVERKTKSGMSTVNLMEGIFSISTVDNYPQKLNLALQSGSTGNVRPEIVIRELLRFMGVKEPESVPAAIHRNGLFIQQDGSWVSPMALKRR